MSTSPHSVKSGSLDKRDTAISLGIIGLLFFVFGFVSWANAILIPYFRLACELSNFESYLVTFAFYISYLLISVPSAFLLKRYGFKKGMMIGFWIMAMGAFIFVPAALTRTFGLFLCGLFSLGAGLAVLQTAANPYVTILGDRERAAQRISLMGICNKGAGILAPIIFAAVILRNGDGELFKSIPALAPALKAKALDELIRRVVIPYTCVGSILFLLGLLVRFSPLPEVDAEDESSNLNAKDSSKGIFQFPHLILGALAIFLHVGTQVVAIDTIIGYAESMHVPLMEAKVFPSYTLFATIAGYSCGILLIPRWVSQVTALRFCTLLGVALTFLIIFSHGQVHFLGHRTDISIWFVTLLGLANSLVWAAIWPLALAGLGRFTKVGASLMIMGLCGNAIIPLIYGLLSDRWDVRQGYWVLMPCYGYLVFYAFFGHQLHRWRNRVMPVVA